MRMKPIPGLALALGLAWSAAAAEPASYPASVVREDLAALRQGLDQAHYDLYAHRTRAEHDQLYAALSGKLTAPMAGPEAEALLQRFAAFGKVGHARIDAPVLSFRKHLGEGGRFTPLFIRVDEGRTLVTFHADREGRVGPGFEILTLQGEPIATWLERAGALVSAERPYMTHALLEQAFPAVLWLLLGEVDGVKVTGRDAQGRPVQTEIRSVTLTERRALAAQTPRLAVDFNAREFRMLGEGVGYLRPGPFAEAAGDKDGAFHGFIDDSFRQLMAAGARDLILDLRNNPGGDNSFSDPMIAWFADRPFRFASSFRLRASPQAKAWYAQRLAAAGGAVDPMLAALAQAEAAQADGARYDFELPIKPPRPETRFTGTVHVLVNRHSYSNAASAAALIQDYGFGKVIGEETADVPTTYASVLSFTLPSGIVVTYPKSRIVRPSGDERLLGVVPDHVLAREPVAAATDTVLEAAVEVVRRGRSE